MLARIALLLIAATMLAGIVAATPPSSGHADEPAAPMSARAVRGATPYAPITDPSESYLPALHPTRRNESTVWGSMALSGFAPRHRRPHVASPVAESHPRSPTANNCNHIGTRRTQALTAAPGPGLAH
jgi:hypothetical protein